MSRPPLYFEQVIVHRMHGFRKDGPRINGLSPGINVIYGPNGAGKTTLACALQVLLWPETNGHAPAALTGKFTLDEQAWGVDVEAGRVRYQYDGRSESSPGWPGGETCDRYHLSLQDLLRAASEDLVALILQEASGGYDVAKAAEAQHFKLARPRSGDATHRAKSARIKRNEARQVQRRLRNEQRELENLKEEHRNAHKAGARVRLLEEAIAYVRVQAMLEEAMRTVEAYPPALSNMRGDEEERLAAHQDKLKDLQNEQAEARRTINACRENLKENIIPEEGPPTGLVSRLKTSHQQLKEAETRVEKHGEDLKGAREQERKAWERIKGPVDPEAARQLDFSGLDDLIDFAQEAEQARAEKKAFEKQEGLFGKAKAPEHLDAHRDAMRQLLRWLQVARTMGNEAVLPPRLRYLLFGSAVVMAAVGIFIGLMWHPLWLLLLVIAVLLALAGFKKWEMREGGRETRRRFCREAFEVLPIEGPQRWEPAAVEGRLGELFEERADLQFEDLKARTWREGAGERERTADRLRTLEEKREMVAARLGMAPETNEAKLIWLVDRLSKWQDADENVARIQKRREEAHENRKKHLEAVNVAMVPYGFGEAESAAEANQHIIALEEAIGQFERMQADLRHARANEVKAAEDIGEAQCSLTNLFECFDLALGDEVALRELCGKRDAYLEAKEAFSEAEVRARDAKERLQRHPLFEEDMTERAEADLQAERLEMQALADDEEQLRDDISKVEQKIESAEERHDLEEAQAAYRKALADLEAAREEDYQTTAGEVLARHIAQETRDRETPEVLKRAKKLFATVTRHRYALKLGDGGFYAYDEVHERGFGLDELSSGTRVQLLLAVRVAFVEEQEETCKLPLVLDETLANSDDEKAAAIIEALHRISVAGRQVLYFTAQEDEVAKWKRLARGTDNGHCRFIPLGDAPPPDEIDAAALPAAAADVPVPEGKTHMVYGALLDVRAWDAWSPLGKLHLWYLIDDPEALCGVLRAGFRRWGPLRSLADAGAFASVGLTDEQYKRICLFARALAAWQKAWKKGRGRRVDRAALEASGGAVSDTFIDRVTPLCVSEEGDGEAIIHALHAGRVKGFRTHKTEELEAYFLEAGYIDPGERLSQVEMRARMLAAVSHPMREAGVNVAELDDFLERVRVGGPAPS